MIHMIPLLSILAWSITWLIVGKIVFDRLYYKQVSIEIELLSKNNIALAFSFSGFMLGLFSALFVSMDLTYPLYINGLTGIIIMVLILLFTRIFDWIFLKKIDLPTEIIDNKNISSGIIEGSFFFSMGLIISGGFSGEKVTSWLQMYLESIVYCIIGVILLYISSKILSYILKIHMQEELLNKNSAVGASFGGIFISNAIVIKEAISGPVQINIFYDIKITLLDWIFSLFLMILLFFIFDIVLFKKFSFKAELKEPNIGAGIMIGIIFISSALISSLIL